VDPWGLNPADTNMREEGQNTGPGKVEHKVEVTYYNLIITDTNNDGRYGFTFDEQKLSLKNISLYGHDNPFIYIGDKSAIDLAKERASFSGNQLLLSLWYPEGIESSSIVVIDNNDLSYANRLGRKGSSMTVDMWSYKELPNE
jgi:hypothetical protein